MTEKTGTGTRGGGGKASGKAHGLETESCPVQERAELFGRVIMGFSHLLTREKRDRKAEFTTQKFRFFLQLIETVRRMGDMERTLPLRLDIDVVVARDARNEIHGFDLR